MSRRAEPAVIGLVAVFGLAAPAPRVLPSPAVQETSIQLPSDNALSELKADSGLDVTRKSCMVCHSTDYIVRQPHFEAQRWDAEVKKMITVYGAQISDADAKTITDYLARNYGPDATERKKPPR